MNEAASLLPGAPLHVPHQMMIGSATPSEPNAVPAVAAHGLVKTFGAQRAVDGIDLTVAEGEIFGVLGPNGAGKTTMLQMLCTLLPMDSGTLKFSAMTCAANPMRYDN
jgi:ABC-2 type transport system ATP-binding protein